MKKIIILLTLIIVLVFSGCSNGLNIFNSFESGIVINYKISEENGHYTDEELDDTIERLENRAKVFNTNSNISIDDEDRIEVKIPDVSDNDKIAEELVREGALYFCTATDDTPTEEQINNKEYVEIEDQSSGEKAYYQVWVTGDEIVKAEGITGTDQDTKGIDYKVTLQFNDSGAQNFADMTTSAIGSQTYIIYDGEIISAPNVNQTITGGQAEITGMGSLEAAEELASFFNIGKLDLKLDLLSYKYVSEQDNK